MSFFNANSSFFLEAVASICQPFVQIVPLDDAEVFQYLDAHQDALLSYLRERAGLVESLSRTLNREDTLGAAAPEKAGTSAAGDEVTEEDSDEDVLEVASEPVADAEQADEEWATGEEDDQASDEVPSQAGPEECPSHASTTAIDSDDGADAAAAAAAAPAAAPVVAPAAAAATAFPAASNAMAVATAPGFDPAAVEASKKERRGRKWRLFEEEAAIRHMLDIKREGVLKGEARFVEALRRMQTQDGVTRSGDTVVKNFWNRYGRATSVFDERRNKKAPLATSLQGAAKAKGSFSLADEDTADETEEGTDNKEESDDDDCYVPAVKRPSAAAPAPAKQPSQKRSRDDDDELDLATINAVAKGLRAPKKARVSYTA